MPPASRAALYEAIAGEPDITVVPGDVRDAGGRPGVALRDILEPPASFQRTPAPGAPRPGGVALDIIFDRKTFAYLGNRWVGLGASGKETVGVGLARLRTAIVDKLGQLP